MTETTSYPGAPRWVKIFAIVVLGLVSLLVVLKVTGLGGDHGPGRHLQFLRAGDQAPDSGTAGEHKPPAGGH